MNLSKWAALPLSGLIWLVYELYANPAPGLMWVVVKGVIPFAGGLVVFMIAREVSVLTESANVAASRPPFGRAVDPLAWLFGSVTLGCGAAWDASVRLYHGQGRLREFAPPLGVVWVLIFVAIILYGISVHRRARLQPGEFQPRDALLATALMMAVVTLAVSHHLSAMLLGNT
jgi:hypothetical protein